MKSFYIRLGLGILWILIALSNIFSDNYVTVALYSVMGIIFIGFAVKAFKDNKK